MSEVRNLKVWAALLMAALVAGMLMTAVLAGPVQAAATLFVTTAADEQNTNGQCSLREAIVNVNANDQSGSADCGAGGTTEDEIRFDLGSSATIALASPLPSITDSAGLIIAGGGANITISGNRGTSMMIKDVRVFQVDSSGKLTLDDLTVTNGSASIGGGIHNAGTLTVRDSTISDHLANNAGGIQNNPTGTLTVTNSTISGNSANYGAGIYNQGTATVTNSTVSGNTAFIEIGGIYGSPSSTATTTLKNTIVANNVQVRGADCAGTITDGGYNLDSGTSCGFATANNSISGEDPLLGPLADNGGPTLTHALLEGSPAIDEGNSFGAIADQRGISRPLGAASDIGAFEFEDTTAPKVITATPTGKGTSRGTNVAATFSEAMDAATINGATFKLSKAGSTKRVGAAVTYDAASQKAVLDPNKRLAAGTKYKAVVTIGAEDLSGNALDQNPTLAGKQQKTWTFITKG